MSERRPNIVFLFPDQLRADFVGSYGGGAVPTPHMDRLAAEGVRYADAMSASPLCVPARTALLTGMNAMRNGVMGNFHGLRMDYREAGISTWPELVGDAGYVTAAIGKMHFYPWDARLGFQRRVVAEDKRWLEIHDDYHHFLARQGLRRLHGREHAGYEERQGAVTSPLPLECSPDHFVAAEACRFIEETGDEPFALMVGFPGPHCPYDPVDESLDRVDPDRLPEPIPPAGEDSALRRQNVVGNSRDWNGVDYSEHSVEAQRRLRHHYAALIAQLDDVIGSIIETLERRGLLEDTVIVLASDHGDYLGDHGMVGKQGFHESTVRIPLVVRPPGGTDPVVRPEKVELRDITATILAYAGIEIPAHMDARPLPGLDHETAERDVLFGSLGTGWMLYDGRYKVHKYRTGEIELFDISQDPGEQHDLAKDPEHLDVLLRLDGRLTAEIMGNLDAAFADRAVEGDGPLYLDRRFGREGWHRTYPAPPLRSEQ